MHTEVKLEFVRPITVAAVRAHVPISKIAETWKPALDKVWAFLRLNRVPNTGLNVFLYHHPGNRGGAMDIDFGVEVTQPFDAQTLGDGEVICVETSGGEVAETIHIGPYDQMGESHDAIHRWCKVNQRQIAAASWEIYGHWSNDPEKLQTTIRYLLS
jgi:effector-binding domain-containing protein